MFFFYILAALIATAIAAVLSARKRVESLPAACPTSSKPPRQLKTKRYHVISQDDANQWKMQREQSRESSPEPREPYPSRASSPEPRMLGPYGLPLPLKRNEYRVMTDAYTDTFLEKNTKERYKELKNMCGRGKTSEPPKPPPVAAGFHISSAALEGARKKLRTPTRIANPDSELVTGIRKVLENGHNQAGQVGAMVKGGMPVRQAVGWMNQHIE